MIDTNYKNKMSSFIISHMNKHYKNNIDIFTIEFYSDFKQNVKISSPLLWIICSIFISGIIIYFGIQLSIKYNDWTIFSRSGSLLILVTLFIILIEHSKFFTSLIRNLDENRCIKYSSILKKIIRRKIVQTLRKYQIQKSSLEIDYLVEKEFYLFIEYFSNITRISLKEIAQRIELIIGIIGTIIWGFGDLISFI